MPSNIYSGAKSLVSRTPGFVQAAFGSFLFGEAVKVLHLSLPGCEKITDYLFLSHTITWFIDKKTTLSASVNELAKWINEDKKEITDVTIVQEELAAKVSQLISDVESVIGFVRYVTLHLPQDNSLAATRSN